MANEIKLFRQHQGSIGTWRAWSEGNTLYVAHSTVLGGSEVVHREVVQTNQSGRTIDEQVKLRINSRVSRMRDKGYQDTIELAQTNRGNQLGLDRPMLAHPIQRVKNVDFRGAVLQKKLDGHRCLITRSGGELIAYSRLGKRIDAIRHVLRAVDSRIGEGTTIDGELYAHGVPLQTIGSWIKREQPATSDLYFVAYDLISDQRYVERHAELSEILRGTDTQARGQVVVLPYREYQDADVTGQYLREVRADGFEGLMLRLDRRRYEAGTRSNALIKLKEFLDAEFEVIGFERSKQGWAVCRCLAPNGAVFGVSAPGDLGEKLHVWENQADYLHRKLTVQFPYWTLDGIPFQPTALRWYEPV